MWYKFDVNRFAEQMLPPRLRSRLLLAFLRALLRPLGRLLELLKAFREWVHRQLSTSGQTFSLEGALNHRYNLPQGAIYITDTKDNQLHLYFIREGSGSLYVRKSSEAHDPLFLSYAHEGKHGVDFIVHVPSFLRDKEDDIRRFINFYKPAGRTYKITFYEYE